MASTKAVLVPEERLLLALAGGASLDPEIQRLGARALDWDYLVQITALERAEAVVSSRLTRLGVTLPEPSRKQLKSRAGRSDLRMAMLSHRLDQTLQALGGAGVPVILLKGAALGRTIYGSLPRRPMLDLDLLIPRDGVARARDVALATGWKTGPLEQRQDFYGDHYHLPPMFDASGAEFNLELHHGLFFKGHPFEFDAESLWSRAVPLAGTTGVFVPSTADMIIHLCLHFAWSHTMRAATWRTFRDLDHLTRLAPPDWEVVVREAIRIRGASCCYWTLRQANELAGVTVPAEVLRRLRPPLASGLEPMLARHFAQQWYPRGAACPSVRLFRALWRLAIRPEYSGHGGVMPWQRDESFLDLPAGDPARLDVPTKVGRHLRGLGAYARYARQLLVTND